MISLSFMFGEVENDEFWMSGTSGNVEKLCFPYADYVRVPIWQFVLEIALFILWITALLFSILSLLVKLIKKIVNTCRKKTIVTPLGRWSALAAFLQVSTVVLLAVMAASAFSYALASSYAWMTVVFGAISVSMVGLIIYGVLSLRKSEAAKKRKLYHWITVILLVSTVINILYWNLFMWWELDIK